MILLKLKLFEQSFKGWAHNQQGEARKLRKELHIELIALEELEENVGLSSKQVI